MMHLEYSPFDATMDMAPEVDGEMVSYPAQLHFGMGGQDLVFLEGGILDALGPWLGSSGGHCNL